MAGSVIIDEKTVIAFNSYGFDLVAELTRDALKINDSDLIANIYESMDSGYMPFIRLDTLGGTDIERFYLATKKAFLEWKQCNSIPFHEWNDLIEKLEHDERVNGKKWASSIQQGTTGTGHN
jgi:hypothetical protein